jgi:hypothetical protein
LMRKVPLEELMDTLIHEVELLAKEKRSRGRWRDSRNGSIVRWAGGALGGN